MFHGKYMYLAGGKGLKIFDAQTDVFQPVPVGEIIDTGALSRKGGVALQIVDNYLYVAGGGGGSQSPRWPTRQRRSPYPIRESSPRRVVTSSPIQAMCVSAFRAPPFACWAGRAL